MKFVLLRKLDWGSLCPGHVLFDFDFDWPFNVIDNASSLTANHGVHDTVWHFFLFDIIIHQRTALKIVDSCNQ